MRISRDMPGNHRRTGRDERGAVLVPCVFMLSLLTLLAVGILEVGGMETSIAGMLTKRAQARQAALSGVEIAYHRLSGNLDYPGEACSPLHGKPGTVDIAVTSLGDDVFEVFATGSIGSVRSVIRTRARAEQSAFGYPLLVGGDMIMNGPDPLILSDCFVTDVIWAKCGGRIAGDLSLAGTRQIILDFDGKPISIDGYNVPVIDGNVRDEVLFLGFPTVDLASLRAMAFYSGHIYSGNTQIRDEDLHGVVYVENAQNLHLKNGTTINGVLVCDNVEKIHIHTGHFKFTQDMAVAPFMAIVAPGSEFHVNPNTLVEVFGLTLVGSADFHGDGSFTGPVFVEGDLRTFPHTELLCQCPPCMCDAIYSLLSWNGCDIVEVEYEEP